MRFPDVKADEACSDCCAEMSEVQLARLVPCFARLGSGFTQKNHCCNPSASPFISFAFSRLRVRSNYYPRGGTASASQ
jgi:hypothetical protein